MDKVIAVDIDNVLNDFDDILGKVEFPYDKTNSSWGSAWNHAHKLAHVQAKVKQGASEFLCYLKQNNYRVIIMTRRDLRYALEYTKIFLKNNNLPYDDILQSNIKAVTCSLWNIPILIDDEIEPIMLSNKLSNPVQVYYPIMDKHNGIAEDPHITAIGYHCFKELKQWIK